MLGWRLTVSAIVIPLLVGVFVTDHKMGADAYVLLGVCLLLSIRGAWEMAHLLTTRSFRPNFPILAACSSAVVAAGWIGQWDASTIGTIGIGSLGLSMLTFSVCVLVLFLKGCIQYREPGQSMETLGAEILTVVYVGVLLIITAQLRWLDGGATGYFALASVVIAAKLGDVGGYTFGRLWGKKKLVPILSPGKTQVGGYGALFGAALGSVLWLCFLGPKITDTWNAWPIHWAIIYGVIIGAVGLVGDLCESLIKRDVEKKDSAQLMPGFGGLLDLLDSVLYAGPVAYILWLIYTKLLS